MVAVAAPDDAGMSLFMMKLRLGLAAGGSGGNTHTSPRSAAPYAAPLTPPSSDCGGDFDYVQTAAVTSVQEPKGDVMSVSEQVRELIANVSYSNLSSHPL